MIRENWKKRYKLSLKEFSFNEVSDKDEICYGSVKSKELKSDQLFECEPMATG